jgi:hypothetical protein
MAAASLKIHCVNNTRKIEVGQVCFVKQMLDNYREGIGFSGGYFYANDIFLQDDKIITISEHVFYEIRDGVLNRGKIIYYYFL